MCLKTVELKSVHSSITICPHCHQQTPFLFIVKGIYVTFLRLKLFPLYKKGQIQCAACQNETEPNQLPGSFQEQYQKVKREAKTPLRSYIMPLLLLSISLWILINLNIAISRQNEYIAHPQVGDRYRYEIQKNTYTLLKVIAVSDNTVTIVQNRYHTARRSQTKTLDYPDNYSTESRTLTLDELRKMKEEDFFFNVQRKTPSSADGG